VHALLWKLMLRIARSEIRWDQQNMRWGGGSPGSIERQVSILNGRDKMRSADESPLVGSEQHQELVCRRCLIAIVRVSYHAVGEVGLRHRKSGPQDGEISAVLGTDRIPIRSTSHENLSTLSCMVGWVYDRQRS
jgi:hypothetical protein